MRRGNIGIDKDTGAWVTLDTEPTMPLDEPKCSMMQARVDAT